MLQLQLLYKR